MMNYFETFVPGKWVLAGEHAVLRGGRAVALPRHDIGLRLTFEPDSRLSRLEVDPMPAQDVIQGLASALIDKIKVLKGVSVQAPRGILKLQSSIPIGGGLGSSSALCVAMVRLMTSGQRLSVIEQIEWATELENRFHGRSSGMDISVATLGRPILFAQGPIYEPIQVSSLPSFRFHDTELRAKTLDCIEKVASLASRDPVRAAELDEKMKQAALDSVDALVAYERGETERSLQALSQAIHSAQECFEGWGLVPERVSELAQKIKRSGALAVKLTGAGNGGFLVSLWPSE